MANVNSVTNSSACSEAQARKNVRDGFTNGYLQSYDDSLFVLDAEKYQKATGKKDLKVRDVKCGFGIADKKLTTGLAGEKNDFYIGAGNGGSYDGISVSDKRPLSWLKDLMTGTKVYLPKSEVQKHY